jgi:hypothetical protein
MSFLQPKPEDMDLMHYLRTASKIDGDNIYLKAMARESETAKRLHEAQEEHARAIAMTLALQYIREFGAVNMGKVRR